MALNPMDRVVRDISDIKRQLAGRSQLNHSSLENTAIPVYDGDGIERLRIGAQDDGTHSVKYVQGPPPPRPTAPVVSVDGPVVRVRWDGMLMGGHIPEDFSRIDVHFALASDDLEAEGAVRGNLATSAGNETVLAATQTGTYRVGLVAMSQSRARSEMSETVDVEVELVNLKGAIDTAVDNASGGSNHYRPAPPEGTDHTENDLWFDTSVDPETGLTAYTPHRWDEAAQGWVSVGDQRTAAIQDAQDALRVDVDQIITDGSGATTYWLPTEPDETTDPPPKLGDIWFNTADGNKLSRHDGQGWALAADERIQTIQDAHDDLSSEVDTVRTSVDGKNAITQSVDAPPTQYDGAEGDRWERMSSMGSGGSLISNWRWNGDVWVSTIISDAVLGNVDAAKIGTGYLDADRIEAGSLTAGKVLIGGGGNVIPWAPAITTYPHEPRYGATLTGEVDPDVGALMRVSGGSQSDGSALACLVLGTGDTVPGIPNSHSFMPLDPGRSYFLTASMRIDGTIPGNNNAVRYEIQYRDGLGAYIGRQYSSFHYLSATDPQDVSMDVVAPAGAAFAVVHVRKNFWSSGDLLILAPSLRIRSGATLIEGGAITTEKIAAGAITAESGVIGSLDAGKITVGEMDAARLAAGSITADKLLIGGAQNLVPGVQPGSNRGMSEFVWDDTEKALTPKDSGKTIVYSDEPFFLAPGEYVIEADIKASVEGTRTYIGAFGLTTAWNYRYGISNVLVSTEWRHFSATLSIPEGHDGEVQACFLPAYSGEVTAGVITWYRNVTFRRMVGTTLIEGGAITTEKIAVGAITAESGIIGSLDAGVITVGEMNGARIEAGTIDTPQLAFGAATGDVLSVDALNFKTAVGLDIRGSSFRAGDAVEMTEDFGIRQFGPDGALNVSLPSDGSPAEFRGDLSARTLTATGRMSIQGPGAIASGGVLELESGVVPPISSPSVNMTWGRTSFPTLADEESAAGLAWGDGHWWRAVQTNKPIADGGVARIEKITTEGELVSSFEINSRSQVYGITILNDTIYVLCWPLTFGGGDRYVIGYDYDGVEKTRWVYAYYGTGTYAPGIGNDGTNIVIVQPWKSGLVTWRLFNATTGVRFTQIDTTKYINQDLVGIHFGQFDYEQSRVVITIRRKSGDEREQFLVYNNRADTDVHVEKPWMAANMENPTGSAWVDGRWYSLGADGSLYQYESIEEGRFAGDNDGDWWLATTWWSEGEPNAAQETPAGPAQRFRYLHRARIRHSVSDVPEGVGRIRFYLAKRDSAPQRTDLRWVSHIEATTTTSWTGTIGDDWQTGANPPASNTFATDAPGEIRSAIGGFRVDGAGSGSWGPWDFSPAGAVTGPGTILSGTVEHGPVDQGADADLTITFPAGRFPSPPAVTATSSNGRLTPAIGRFDVTKDSFRLRVWNFSGANNTTDNVAHWIAVEA